MFCYNCGKQLPDGSAFCPYCGAKQNAAGQTQQNFGNNAGNGNGSVYSEFNNYGQVSKKNKNNKVIALIACVVVIVILIVSLRSCSSTAGAKYQIYMGDVSFRIFNECELAEYGDNDIHIDDGSTYIYDDNNNRIGKVEWEYNEYSSAEEASENYREDIAFVKAFASSTNTFNVNGITVTMFKYDSDECTFIFQLNTGEYFIETDGLSEKEAMKIAKSVNK